MKNFKILEIMELFDEGEVTTADQIDRPQSALDREMFEDANKRFNKAGGGMLVQPGFGGTRQGYAEDLPSNVYKNKQGNYVYRSGKGDDVIYKSGFKTPEAASKWGQKEFVKKFALPNKFVSSAELSEILDFGKGKGSGMQSPLFERGDRPRYLLQEARKILGSYQAGGRNFFRAPTKKEIEYLKKYSKAPLIQENLAKNVQIILDSKAIMNDLSGKNKGGAKLPEFNKVIQVFKNAGVNASDAQITNALQKAAYLLRGDTFQTDVKYDVDKNTGRFIIKELEKLPFDNQYARGIYKHALNEIRLELGETAGNLESFKRNLRKRLPDGFLQKHGLEINEIFSVRASAKNKSFPYAYFLDATDAELNKKALRSFHGALSRAQTDLNNKIADIRAGKAKYDEAVDIIEKFQKTRSKFKNTIETNYPGKNFNLANIVLGKESEVLKKNMKIPGDVYSKKLLDKWKSQGLDITGHAKKTGYVMTGADNPGVFTAQDLSRDKTIRDSFIKQLASFSANPKCRGSFSKGGRIGYATGPANLSECAISGRDRLEKIIKTGAKLGPKETTLATQILRAGRSLGGAFTLSGLLGPQALLFAGLAEAGIVGYDMLTTGNTLRESIGGSLLNYALGDKTKINLQEETLERFGKLPGMTEEKLAGITRVLDQTNKINTMYKKSLDVENLEKQVKADRAEPRDTFMSPDDDLQQTDQAIRTEQKLEDEKQNLLDLKNIYTKPDPSGVSPFESYLKDYESGAFEKAQKDLAEANRLAAIQKLESRGPVIAGILSPKFEEGRQQDLLTLRSIINPASAFAIKSYENPESTFQPVKPFGLAGGGIAKLAGIDQGPQTESMNPDSQGLPGILKRGIKR